MVAFGALAGREASAATVPWLNPDLPDGTRSEAHLVQSPGKRPLIQLSDSPPNLETPIQAFQTAITPNDQFFVRYLLDRCINLGLSDAGRLTASVPSRK